MENLAIKTFEGVIEGQASDAKKLIDYFKEHDALENFCKLIKVSQADNGRLKDRRADFSLIYGTYIKATPLWFLESLMDENGIKDKNKVYTIVDFLRAQGIINRHMGPKFFNKDTVTISQFFLNNYNYHSFLDEYDSKYEFEGNRGASGPVLFKILRRDGSVYAPSMEEANKFKFALISEGVFPSKAIMEQVFHHEANGLTDSYVKTLSKTVKSLKNEMKPASK